jgi:redox-sensitive bicupin YhaK (pirin superfamily)
MKTINLIKRPAQERGQADHGWLKARFSFSFGNYFDPDHMGFRSLRVMNNDTIAPGGGFPPHPHESMEIFTYVVEGQLEHKDSMGNGAIIQAGDLQYMSAGNGIRHSEGNPSATDKTVMYQIWIQPKEDGGEPRYAEKPLRESARTNELTLLFSPDGRDGSPAIRQDAEIHFAKLDEGGVIDIPLSEWSQSAWIQVIDGEITTLGESLQTGDGLAIENLDQTFTIKAASKSTVLFFRL